MLDGFMVEAGGKDFEEGSISLYYEMMHGWKVGLPNQNMH